MQSGSAATVRIDTVPCEGSDIESQTPRLASVTLESDSLSETPKHLRSKRRRRIPKREKLSHMEVDKDDEGTAGTSGSKMYMDWEHSMSGCVSDIDFSSDNSHEDDADDEQSDWPDYTSYLMVDHARREQKGMCNQRQFHSSTQAGSLAPPSTSKTTCLTAGVLKKIERFVGDSQQRELILTQVYRTSLVKKMLAQQGQPFHVLKRGRGTVILRKTV